MQQSLPQPRLIFWEVTKACNLRCVHCRATAHNLSSLYDLPTNLAFDTIQQVSQISHPILVLSGGEPLLRPDIFDLAAFAVGRGLTVALATNGTLVTREIAGKIAHSGIRRVSISLDGADAGTHDKFRRIPGSFDDALQGFENLREWGVSLQINVTVARHNAHQLPQILEMARSIGADALHTFMLVPVGCGVEIAGTQMLPAAEYEEILNWFYDREMEGELEMKATCSPHYFRVRLQRRAADRAASGPATSVPASSKPAGHPGGKGLNQVTKGCLAGSGVCFISHRGEIFPCGYLPVAAGDLHQESFEQIWFNSPVFRNLRDNSRLKGKCGVCEFRNVCMGCRARAYAATGDYLAEEPFCTYLPRHHAVPVGA